MTSHSDHAKGVIDVLLDQVISQRTCVIHSGENPTSVMSVPFFFVQTAHLHARTHRIKNMINVIFLLNKLLDLALTVYTQNASMLEWKLSTQELFAGMVNNNNNNNIYL